VGNRDGREDGAEGPQAAAISGCVYQTALFAIILGEKQ